MYLNHYPQRITESEISLTDTPAYGMLDAENMLACMIDGCTGSCTIDDARSLLATLRDCDALKAIGLADADQEFIEGLCAKIKQALQD